MRYVRIFLGSSIDDLRLERLQLADFVTRLNNRLVRQGVYLELYECEETSSQMHADGSQKVHDDYIEHQADAALFLFARRAGEYTLGELDLAVHARAATGHPEVLVFFKTTDGTNGSPDSSPDIQACIERATSEYGLPLRTFRDVGDIELELLRLLTEAVHDEAASLRSQHKWVEAQLLDREPVLVYRGLAREDPDCFALASADASHAFVRRYAKSMGMHETLELLLDAITTYEALAKDDPDTYGPALVAACALASRCGLTGRAKDAPRHYRVALEAHCSTERPSQDAHGDVVTLCQALVTESNLRNDPSEAIGLLSYLTDLAEAQPSKAATCGDVIGMLTAGDEGIGTNGSTT